MFRWKNEIGIEGKLQFRVSLNWSFVLGGQLSTSHMPLSDAFCFLASWPCSFGMLRCLFKSGAGQGTGSDAHPWESSERQVSLPCTYFCCAGPFSSWCPAGAQGYFFSPLLCLPAKGQCGYANTGQPLTDTKAQQNVAHFWWALAATCNIFLGGDQLG